MIWISNPLVYYGFLAAGLLVCLHLFVSMKLENARLRRKLEKQQQAAEDANSEFRTALGNLEHSLKEQDRKDDQFVPPPVMPGVSINLTKRSQALRMYRRGETAEHISAALQMPRAEVDLLLKVQQALAEQSN
jgi:hypothetical protein